MLVCHPLSSLEGAGSLVLPVENVAVTPPINDAVPLPTDGAFVPVPGLPSGGTLLKFHWAMISARADASARVKQPTNSDFNMVVHGVLSGGH